MKASGSAPFLSSAVRSPFPILKFIISDFFSPLLCVADFAYFLSSAQDSVPWGKFHFCLLVCRRDGGIAVVSAVTDAPSPTSWLRFFHLALDYSRDNRFFCDYWGSRPSSSRCVLCKTGPARKSYDLRLWEPRAF